MNIYSGLCQNRNRKASPKAGGTQRRSGIFFAAVLAGFLVLALDAPSASSQVVPSGYKQSLTYFGGATATGQYLQYGERKQWGVTGFLELDTSHHIGAVFETSWIHPRQPDNLHTLTYQGGVRYRMNFGKLEPYAKALAGVGEFSYPYHYFDNGSFLIVSPGGGVDYRLNSRIRLRVVDFEYTYWPEFSYNPGTTTPISSATVSSGIRVRIF
jgi:hypothetical protein